MTYLSQEVTEFKSGVEKVPHKFCDPELLHICIERSKNITYASWNVIFIPFNTENYNHCSKEQGLVIIYNSTLSILSIDILKIEYE